MWARLGNMNNQGNRGKCVEPPPEGAAVLGFPNFPYLRFSSLTTQKNVLSNKKEEIRQTEGKIKTRTFGDMFITRTFRKNNRNHGKVHEKRHLEITRPAQLA